MQCKQCRGPTTPKKTQFGVGYECQTGCLNPKNQRYPLTTWPAPQAGSTTKPNVQNNAVSGQNTAILKAILESLRRIEAKLPAGQHEAMNALPSEIEPPQEEAPF